MTPMIRYASFLIRIWHPSKFASDCIPYEWQCEVEHIQSSHCWTFHSLDDLLSFLQQQIDHPEGTTWMETSVETNPS